MMEFKCDTRSQGNFLYGEKQSVFTFLYDCIINVRWREVRRYHQEVE